MEEDIIKKINNLDDKLLSDQQRKTNKIIIKKELELNFEMEKFKKYLANSKKFYSYFLAFFIFLFMFFLVISLKNQKDILEHSEGARISIVQVLRKLNNKIDLIPQGKSKNLKVINQKIVPYKNKKYLKILKKDLIDIGNNPKHKYLLINVK